MSMPTKIFAIWALCAATILAVWPGAGTGVTSAIIDYQSIESSNSMFGTGTNRETTNSKETTAVSFVSSENEHELLTGEINETAVSSIAWPLTSIRAYPYPEEGNSNPPVLVAILDTGIDDTHEDLIGKVVSHVSMVDGTDAFDYHGHGTFIAGIIAANINNNIGIDGLAPECRLLNIKVADDRGRCRHDDLAEGIVWAVDHGAQVINISIEMQNTTALLEAAVDYAWQHGVAVIAAAGNEGSDSPVYPAAYSTCLSVTAIRSDLSLAPLANYGDWVDVAAPGFDIFATLPGDGYGYEYGTSFAAAYVSGLAARLFACTESEQADVDLRDEIVRSILYGCRDIGIEGAGFGMIDVQRSIEVLTSVLE